MDVIALQTPYITIHLAQRQLHLYKTTEHSETFPVAIGKPATPTPIGNWKIQNKKILTDASVFGSHWLGLNLPGYGIHGTNQPTAIGSAVSGGCIRMHNKDVQYLFNQVSIGTPVVIVE